MSTINLVHFVEANQVAEYRVMNVLKKVATSLRLLKFRTTEEISNANASLCF